MLGTGFEAQVFGKHRRQDLLFALVKRGALGGGEDHEVLDGAVGGELVHLSGTQAGAVNPGQDRFAGRPSAPEGRDGLGVLLAFV